MANNLNHDLSKFEEEFEKMLQERHLYGRERAKLLELPMDRKILLLEKHVKVFSILSFF
jgi:hypothetical protein